MSEAVVLGMDPQKRSVTIEAIDGGERVLGGGRYLTTVEGYAQMLAWARQFGERVWAIEGCNGIGRHIAERLLADGEQVVDVPPKLSARMRVYATGQGRKTDATDAHSVALVGVRITGLRPVVSDTQRGELRVLVDRRRALGEDHVRMTCQLHALLLELIPGGAKNDLSAAQAKKLLATVRPRDAAGKARRRVAAELIGDLERVYRRQKAAPVILVIVSMGVMFITNGVVRFIIGVDDQRFGDGERGDDKDDERGEKRRGWCGQPAFDELDGLFLHVDDERVHAVPIVAEADQGRDRDGQAGQHPSQRRFPCAVGAQQRHRLAGVDAPVDQPLRRPPRRTIAARAQRRLSRRWSLSGRRPGPAHARP